MHMDHFIHILYNILKIHYPVTSSDNACRMTERLHGSNSRGLDLIEKWPKHTASNIPRQNSDTKFKKVRFAEYSKRRIYVTDSGYEDRKSYSSAEQNIFRKEASREGLRIRSLVSSCPGRIGSAVHLLLSRGLLSREELLGIESFLSANPKQESHDRQSHRDLILTTQRDIREKNDNMIECVMLAMVAIPSSSGRIEKARLRAVLAL